LNHDFHRLGIPRDSSSSGYALERLADALKKNGYGQYLLQLLRDRENAT